MSDITLSSPACFLVMVVFHHSNRNRVEEPHLRPRPPQLQTSLCNCKCSPTRSPKTWLTGKKRLYAALSFVVVTTSCYVTQTSLKDSGIRQSSHHYRHAPPRPHLRTLSLPQLFSLCSAETREFL